MKIRLEGTEEEIIQTVELLKESFHIWDKSRLYPNRTDRNHRCYLVIKSITDDGNQPKHDDAVLGGNK